MNELWLLALTIAAPSLDLYPRVVALAKAPSPEAIHSLMVEAVDRDRLLERIMVDVTTLDTADRDRLGDAIIRHLEARAASNAAPFTCDRPTESKDGPDRVLKLDCRRQKSRGAIELWISSDGRIYDAALEGALLSRNLRAQVNKGLRTHGLEEVLRQLND